MKFIIKTAVLAAALSLCTCAAYAQTEVVPKVDENNHVTVTVETDYTKESIYTFMVYKPEYKDVNDCYKIETVKGANGAQIAFNIKDGDPSGIYTVIVGGGEIRGEKKTFVLATSEDKAAAFAAIKGGSWSALEQYNNKVWVVDLNNAYINTDKANAQKSFENYLPDTVISAQQVETAYRQASTVNEIKYAAAENVAAVLANRKELLGANISENVLKGDAKINEAFTYLAKDGTKYPLTNTSELEALAKKAEALGMMNGADRKSCMERLRAYAPELGITVDSSIDEYELVKALIASDTRVDCTSIEEFVSKYNNAVTTAKNVTYTKPPKQAAVAAVRHRVAVCLSE